MSATWPARSSSPSRPGTAVKDDVYNVGHESMNFTKEDVARKILEHVDYYLHFAEVGHDADQRNYEVSYEKIRKKGFETTIDLDRGIAELVRAASSSSSRTRSPTSEIRNRAEARVFLDNRRGRI